MSLVVCQNKKHKATEAMMTVSMDLQNAEPVLTSYVNALLKQRVYELMHLDGFVEPNALPEAMADIDYGLYSLSSEDELNEMLSESRPLGHHRTSNRSRPISN